MTHVRCQVSGVTCQVSHFTSNSQTVRARELKFWEKVHLSHLSPVTCHVSRVTCHMSHFLLLFFLQSGEASRWMAGYQRGRPRLVFVGADMFPHAFSFAEVAIAAWALDFGGVRSWSEPWLMLLCLCLACIIYPVWGFVVFVVVVRSLAEVVVVVLFPFPGCDTIVFSCVPVLYSVVLLPG